LHLYLHIPFCKQACHYCDFHFSTNMAQKGAMTEAIAREIVLRKSYLPSNQLSTIYFGGGTPSLLSGDELDLLLGVIKDNFEVSPHAEITLEANPDDLNTNNLRQFALSGINRLSIGIQSFYEPHLQFLNRAHNALEAEACVRNAQEVGIENISVDLIYAIPHPDHTVLDRDISKVVQLGISHVSAYCLTIEPQTAFGKWVKTKKLKPIDEDFAAHQFEILINGLATAEYEQYEISNFARGDHYSRHNTSYWQRKAYLGVGPSAHSYDGVSREFNVSNNARYIASISRDEIPATVEMLSAADQTNEYLLTSLRTKWGTDLAVLDELSAGKFSNEHQGEIASLAQQGLITLQQKIMTLTAKGKLFADRISGDLFID
jgi:oxygen-independent coproporphyrinogen-3 oxidase